MRYVALLRGINVGGNNKVEMARLKALFEGLGCTEVATYINSGNVLFESALTAADLLAALEGRFEEVFGFGIPTLIKTGEQMAAIAGAVPAGWENDTVQRTDVAYLFPEADRPGIVDELPVNREFVDVRYTPGALFWNLERVNVNGSRLNKLVGSRLFQQMTVRNINTARYLGR